MGLRGTLARVGAALVVAGCGGGGGGDGTTSDGTAGSGDSSTVASTADTTAGGPFAEADVHAIAGGCYEVHGGGQWLAATESGFAFTNEGTPTAFFFKASDLATYLLYDAEGGYLVSDDGTLTRQTTLDSDVSLTDDTYVSGAEWQAEISTSDPDRLVFVNRRNATYLGASGLVPDEAAAVAVGLVASDACTPHPELTLDAEGEITKTTFDDGTLYGIVDTHSHILSNFAFGGGGIFHGAPFHRLGVQHALSDCALYHGEMGRKDFFGYAFDTSGAGLVDINSLLPGLLAGQLEVDNHATAGYPDFTEWPNGPKRSTHQTQYYKWLERAWMSGLRLVVQHATTNSIICHMTVGEGLQQVRYSCEDMVAVDRIIDETYALERYIDAQSGGPGEGWFRIVTTPQDARDVIASGKMAVVLGIETSDLFNCRITPREGDATCDADYVRAQLDDYYARGIRVLFPVHKYDNLFSAGDGDRAFIELGNFFNGGHWSNFTQKCPDIPIVFDKGEVAFGGLNVPREDYLAPPDHDFSNFPTAPLGTAFQFIGQIMEPPLTGEWCQNAGLTELGETLMLEMMSRGMIIEIDHMPQRSAERALQILEDNDYPAVGTHGNNHAGRLYQLGGISKTGLGRCREAEPGAMTRRLGERIDEIVANGGYPAEGFGFDLNGFAGAPGPRFAEGACPIEQTDPITYPFDSYAGDVTFTQPVVGNRQIDFNDEGMVHIGMLPELIEDARRDAISEADLEPLFSSAEGYIRMWERAEQRAVELGQ